MRAVRSKNTAPEMRVRQLLHSMGYRYRLHAKNLPGKPDIVFPGRKKVIFVHGCFWHGHDCARGDRIPKTNTEYWISKITRNRDRDASIEAEYGQTEWKMKKVWECETHDLSALSVHLVDFLESDAATTNRS